MAVTICPAPNHLTLSRWPLYVSSIRNLSGISVMPTRGPNSPHYPARSKKSPVYDDTKKLGFCALFHCETKGSSDWSNVNEINVKESDVLETASN